MGLPEGHVISDIVTEFHMKKSLDMLHKMSELYRTAHEMWPPNIDGLVQEKRNSSALAMELRLSCTNPNDI